MEKRISIFQRATNSRRPNVQCIGPKLFLGLLLLVVSLPGLPKANAFAEQWIQPARRLVGSAVDALSPLLEVFQVYPPVLTPFSGGFGLTNGSAEDPGATYPHHNSTCITQQTLMQFSFGNSYGNPFVGPYTPPPNCDFNRVTFNLVCK